MVLVLRWSWGGIGGVCSIGGDGGVGNDIGVVAIVVAVVG